MRPKYTKVRARFDNSKYWVEDFEDFSFYRMDVVDTLAASE